MPEQIDYHIILCLYKFTNFYLFIFFYHFRTSQLRRLFADLFPFLSQSLIFDFCACDCWCTWDRRNVWNGRWNGVRRIRRWRRCWLFLFSGRHCLWGTSSICEWSKIEAYIDFPEDIVTEQDELTKITGDEHRRINWIS